MKGLGISLLCSWILVNGRTVFCPTFLSYSLSKDSFIRIVPHLPPLRHPSLEFLRCVDLLSWDEGVALTYAKTRADLKGQGKTLPPRQFALFGSESLDLHPIFIPDFTENLVLIGKELRQHINRLISPTNQCAVKSMPGYKLTNPLIFFEELQNDFCL